MKTVLLTVEIKAESDVVLSRQRARLLAELLDFDPQDQTRIATAVSEVARNAFQYGDRGRAQFALERRDDDLTHLCITISDRGPGIANIAEVLQGPYPARNGLGIGLRGAKKLVDGFRVDSSPAGTIVELSKALSPRAARALDIPNIAARLAAQSARSPIDEVRQQNQDLLRALEELRNREEELTHLNRELAETNTGVLALYAELEEKAEALRGSSALKARFHSQMSHEIRTPINSILSISEILLNGTVADPLPEQERPLGFIRKAAHQLSELVNDLLDLAKVEAGKMIVRYDSFSVSDLFGALRGMFRPLHRNEAVKLVFEDTDHLPELHTDEGKISQVLRNFISNALKFTERGEVRVSAVQDGDQIIFSVSDTGIGIDPGDQALLFRDFAQIDSPKQRTVHGTGLGLALARDLANLLEGSVSVSSATGVGSVFRLTVPRALRSSQPTGATWAEERGSGVDPEGLHGILLIDDDEVSRYALRAAIGNVPCAVVETSDGAEGLREAKARSPRVIFLDLNMPGLDGFEVLARLKADAKTHAIPVVINSARRLSEAELARLEPMTLAVLSKSTPLTEAVAQIREVLRTAGISYAPPREGR